MLASLLATKFSGHNNKNFYWLITNTPQWSSLNENSFCKIEKEKFLI